MKKISFFIIFLIFNISLFANVKLIAPDFFIKGESYIFEYEASGNSVKFPKIEKIDGYLVEDLGTSRSLQIINGNYDEKISRKYKIVPTKNFTIPKLKFEINDEEVFSESKNIVGKSVNKTTSNNFDLTLIPSKNSLYVGEDVVVKLIFKYKMGLQITNLGFEQPHFENFWYKKKNNSNNVYEENGYKVQELEFLLFPQKSGELNIGPLRVDVQMMDSSRNSNFSFFTASPKFTKVYSNELKFDVKKLPNDINLIGEFDIKGSIDKIKVNLGQSISYKLEINGIGNFDDIDDIKLDIPNATVYDNKPEISTSYTSKGYEGKYTKVFSIIPNSSLKIPEVKFKYFSKNEKKIKIKKTKAFDIEVIGKEPKKTVLEKPKENIETKKEVIIKKDATIQEKIIYFLFGIVFSLLTFGLYWFVKLQKVKKTKVDTPLLKLVKKTKDKNGLIKVLIPYLKQDAILDDLIFECQKDEKDFKVLRKEILEKLKDLKI